MDKLNGIWGIQDVMKSAAATFPLLWTAPIWTTSYSESFVKLSPGDAPTTLGSQLNI